MLIGKLKIVIFEELVHQDNELAHTFGIIGQVKEAAIEVKLQRKLGNIQAGIDDSSVVLTHTCKDTSPGDWMSPCSSNGSSLGQWARAKPARRRITFKRMPGEDVSARTAVPRPAGWGTAPAWLAFTRLPSRTNRKIQEEGETLPASGVDTSVRTGERLVLETPRSDSGLEAQCASFSENSLPVEGHMRRRIMQAASCKWYYVCICHIYKPRRDSSKLPPNFRHQ